MNDLIEKLSNLRGQFNCFDKNESDAYHTLSEAIKVISERTKPCEDAVSRADVVDMLEMYPFTEYGEYETAREIVKRLPSVEPKPDQYEDALKKIKNASFVGSDGLDYVETLQALDALKDAIGVTLHVTKISKHCSDFSDLDEVIECEDAVNRQKLLNDLGELITAWKKYPVMAEQIKGVETAIGYVKTIPSVAPKRKTGKWIHSDFSHEFLQCSECGRGRYFCSNFCPNCGADMRSEAEQEVK